MKTHKIFSIGHSLVDIEKFIQKLKEFDVQVLVDVRTTPYSRRAKQFNREGLSEALSAQNISYLYKGKNLGGLGENVDFNETIEELSQLSGSKNIALMCSEGDYKKCHRFLTLTPEFEAMGVIVEHILWKKKNNDSKTSLFD